MLPVGVNPNTQIMGSNCEGSERAKATLSRLSGTSGRDAYKERERRERQRVAPVPRFPPLLPLLSLSLSLCPYFTPLFHPSRAREGDAERGRGEDIVIVLSGRNHGLHSRIYIGYRCAHRNRDLDDDDDDVRYARFIPYKGGGER